MAFVSTTRFKDAVRLLNQVELGKLEKVAATIATRLAERASQSAFTSAEEEQLRALLELGQEDLDTLVAGISYIWEQAAYLNLSPEKLVAQLEEHTVSKDALAALAGVWAKQRLPFVSSLRERTLGAPAVVTDVDWRLQLTMAHQELSKTKVLSAVLDLTLAPAGTAAAASTSSSSSSSSAEGAAAAGVEGEVTERLLMELSKDELLRLYNDLERVQTQLDGLTASK